MARSTKQQPGGVVFHVLNHGNIPKYMYSSPFLRLLLSFCLTLPVGIIVL
jgi:hypothetical protein